eukprot:CAMPEP_0197294552 /NCGR_PEP_ID=MMETSP0890-20130614/32838_1 /TAXON_ID=44058 ORGANISM="Aureoumbra lagunensis, Strain CCMP1510" /NCGR_SAMPLE_ID=MMETSP0890 /ASSEMBLY_ACC=CAM_ASM_000533 /LENGTH=261 /DNA_ID=CAMNT_0042770035 /DNA_START=74 /DNA_END=859 /DNA_ORIENTATION=-
MIQSRFVQLVGATGLGYYGREFLPAEWLERIGVSSNSNSDAQLSRVLSQLGKKLDGLGQQQPSTPQVPTQTIVVRERSRNTSIIATCAILCVIYLRFWKGVRFEDWQPLTRGSLRDVVKKFGDSMDTMRSALASARAAMAERIEKIKESIARIREEISKVHDDVRDVKTDVDATRALAESCDRRLVETSQKQDYANHGIQALCAVVGDLLRNAANTPAIEQLRSFTSRHLPGNGTLSPDDTIPSNVNLLTHSDQIVQGEDG